ncbi:hypothetical protein C9J85_13415 [Haloferax sp. wsp5]|nr:hypothetical protein C9J85_13415 [Haloferax sp. wsp5]
MSERRRPHEIIGTDDVTERLLRKSPDPSTRWETFICAGTRKTVARHTRAFPLSPFTDRRATDGAVESASRVTDPSSSGNRRGRYRSRFRGTRNDGDDLGRG